MLSRRYSDGVSKLLLAATFRSQTLYLLVILSDGLGTLFAAALGAAPWDGESSNGKLSKSLPITFFRSRARRLSWRCALGARGNSVCFLQRSRFF